MSAISGYKVCFSSCPLQINEPKLVFSDSEISNLSLEISKLVEKGAVEKCVDTEGQFLSSFFLVPKPDGSFRFILNLKKLNKFINAEHFKIEDLTLATKLISKNDLLTTIDLQDAYFFNSC